MKVYNFTEIEIQNNNDLQLFVSLTMFALVSELPYKKLASTKYVVYMIYFFNRCAVASVG
jgi:hypothetical protein